MCVCVCMEVGGIMCQESSGVSAILHPRRHARRFEPHTYMYIYIDR